MTKLQIDNVLNHSKDFIHGKTDRVKLALCCVLSEGHILIEDIPGVGKTTLVKYISKVFGFDYSRIQFTSDLLPFDIIGNSVFNKDSSEFIFKKGPIFGQLVLADELNRASGKTQSALLQAMEESEISVDGQTLKLPAPFIVMATQNPLGQIGVNELPESQLDRFMIKMNLGHPERHSSIELLSGENPANRISTIAPLISTVQLETIKNEISKTLISKSIIEYIQNILEKSRSNQDTIGLSMRAGIDIKNASMSWAYMNGRDHVLPDDIIEIFPYLVSHRLYSQDQSFESQMKRSQEFIRTVEHT